MAHDITAFIDGKKPIAHMRITGAGNKYKAFSTIYKFLDARECYAVDSGTGDSKQYDYHDIEDVLSHYKQLTQDERIFFSQIRSELLNSSTRILSIQFA